MTRRTFLSILGTGFATTAVVACASTPPSPTAAPTQASQPTVVPTNAPLPTVVLTSIGTPSVIPATTTPLPVATPTTLTVQLARPNLDHYRNHIALRLQNAANRLPPDRALDVKMVDVRMDKAGSAPRTGADFSSRYAEQVASGAATSDLILVDNASLAALARKDLLRDLGPVLGKETWYKPADFWGNILQTGQVAGKQLGLPLDTSVELVVYNRKRLQERNVSEPPTEWTWDQLIATATALTETGRAGFRVSDWSPSIFSIAWQNGAQVVDSKGMLRVTEPGTIRALEFFDNLAHVRHLSAPLDTAELAQGSDNPFNLIGHSEGDDFPYQRSLKLGQTGMLAAQSTMKFYGVWWEEWKERGGADLGITALPRGDHPVVIGDSWTILGIPAKAANPDRSIEAIRLLLEAFEPVAFLPSRKTVTDLRAIDPLITERDATVLSASLPIARFLPGDVDLPLLELVAKELLVPVVTGKKKPQDAANDAQKAIDKMQG